MKTNKILCFATAFVLVLTGTAMAYDFVDVGNTTSETGHGMLGWGPIEPLNSSGAYGGIDDCRAIWSSLDNSNNAFINLNFVLATDRLYFKHLEGLADDGFEVWINNTKVFTHVENTSTEQWVISSCAPGVLGPAVTVEFRATGPAWASWSTYGQVCFAEIWVGVSTPVSFEENSWGNVKALYR